MSNTLRTRVIPLLIPALVLAVLIHEVLTTSVYSQRDLAAMREEAVALADKGQFDEALERLRAMSEVARKDRGVWGDYLTVLIRAGRADEAIELAVAAPQRELPDYALAALFAAAAQRNDVALAEQFAAREIAQSSDGAAVTEARERTLAAMRAAKIPEPEVAPAADTAVAQAGTRTDAEPAEPESTHSEPARASPPPTGAIAARGPRRFTAQSRSPVTRSSAAGAALGNESPRPAATVAAADAADEPAIEMTAAERARAAVRAAEDAPPGDRIARAYEALHALDRWEQELLTPPTDDGQLRREKFDRVRALTLANRNDEAAALFESIDSPDTPRYALLHGADVYARKREPERATALLDRVAQFDVAAANSNARDLLVARFYIQLDREQYADAEQTLAQLQASASSPAEQRDARVLHAMFAAYQNRPADAQRELEQLQAEVPGDADVAMRLAQIYRWRGWPHRSLAAYDALTPRAPDPVAAQVGAAAAMVDAHRFSDAREKLDELDAQTPRHPDVVQARAEQFKRQRAEYSAQITAGDSNANSVNGNSDLAFEQRLTSAPIADQYRVFAHHRYDRADFPEGTGSAGRIGLGADYRSDALDAAIEITDRMPGGEFGVSISGEWRPGDHWSVFGDLQSDSNLVPLRALKNGIDGESATLGARYRWNESTDARIAYSRVEMSDNASSDSNDRDAISASVRHAVYQSAHHEVAVGANAYHAENSGGSNVPYFNPDNETSYGGTLEYTGILSRRFERSWSHRVVLGAGEYRQQDYSATPIWDIEYQQRWRFNDAFSINAGVLYRSRVYDGDREGYRAFYTGVNWLF